MSSSLRERLDHPVIDADGHTIEFMPQVAEYCREVAGAEVARQFERSGCLDGLPLALEARANGGPGLAIRPPWWAVPARNTLVQPIQYVLFDFVQEKNFLTVAGF